MPDSLPLLLLFGAMIGLIMALSGAGGGVLAVPLLVFGLKLPVQEAAPLALVAVCATAVIGAALGLKDRIVRYRAAAVIGLIGMVAAPAGVWLAHQLPQGPLMMAFSVVLITTAWRMWASSRRPVDPLLTHRPRPCLVNPDEGRLRWTRPCAGWLGLTGVVAGGLSGLLGVGGGFVIVPALTRITNLNAHSIAATSLAVIAMATFSALVASLGHTSVKLLAALVFGGGAVSAMLVGRRYGQRLSPARIQQAFVAVCAVVAVLMFVRALSLG